METNKLKIHHQYLATFGLEDWCNIAVSNKHLSSAVF